MGTNYYISTRSMSACVGHFGLGEYTLTDRPDWGYQIHIGKSSLGRTFLFHGYKQISSLNDLKVLIDSGEWLLYDEYNRLWTIEEFEVLVKSKKNGRRHSHEIEVTTDVDGNEFFYRSFC